MFRTRWSVAARRLSAVGAHAADALTERRLVLEARVEAARHDLDEHFKAQRTAFEELAAMRRAARSGRSVPLPA
jgi:hypothetical protein